jgi:hypothetical protein
MNAQDNPAQKKISWLEGNWEGTGYQIDKHTWTVSFSHTDKKFAVSYPSLGCSGWWKLEKAEKTRLVFTENITINNGCDQGGKVIVSRIDEKNISVSWFIPDLFGDQAVAFTVLHRNDTSLL